MKNQSLQPNLDSKVNNNEFSPEDFSEINQIVETLIASIEDKKKVKRPMPRKKWKKKPKKEKISEIGIRELPFTF